MKNKIRRWIRRSESVPAHHIDIDNIRELQTVAAGRHDPADQLKTLGISPQRRRPPDVFETVIISICERGGMEQEHGTNCWPSDFCSMALKTLAIVLIPIYAVIFVDHAE